MADIRDKFTKTALINVGLFTLAAAVAAAFGVLAGAPVSAALVTTAGIAAVRAAAAVIAVAFGGSAFPGQGEDAV